MQSTCSTNLVLNGFTIASQRRKGLLIESMWFRGKEALNVLTGRCRGPVTDVQSMCALPAASIAQCSTTCKPMPPGSACSSLHIPVPFCCGVHFGLTEFERVQCRMRGSGMSVAPGAHGGHLPSHLMLLPAVRLLLPQGLVD